MGTAGISGQKNRTLVDSLYRLKDNFVETVQEKSAAETNMSFRELVHAIEKECWIDEKAVPWQVFVSLPQTTWKNWSFVYDRKAKVVLPVHYGGHAEPASLLYAFHKGLDIGRFVRENISVDTVLKNGRHEQNAVDSVDMCLERYADLFHEEGFGATYGPGRGLIYGRRFPLSPAERRTFSGVHVYPLEPGSAAYSMDRDY